MLVENTGIAMMDSGGVNGRHWQRNKGKTLAMFEAEPRVSWEFWHSEPKTSEDIGYSLSTFHVLTECAGLEVDELCDEYNRKHVPAKDWEGEAYGTSEAGMKWINKLFDVKNVWNTYNSESSLDQTVQGTMLKHKDNGEWYCLLQVHGGADVRGGYTDARLFKTCESEFINLEPTVYGYIDGVAVSNGYNGHHLTNQDTDETVPVTKESKIELEIYGY